MSLKDQLDADVEAFFRNIDKQLPESQRKTLKLLIDKYAHLYSVPILLDRNDFDMIRSYAHNFFTQNNFPKLVGAKRREIGVYEANTLSLIEGTFMLLNNKECFKKMPKFDYKE